MLFSGSYKTPAERKANPIIELENGMIPRPVRRCFNCAKHVMFFNPSPHIQIGLRMSFFQNMYASAPIAV